MYFPVAGVEVSPFVPPLFAFVVSFFTSMGGVSGAFLLLPFQMSGLGYTNPSVSATNQLYNIVAVPSGVYRYVKEGRMVWPLAVAIAAGTLPGVLAGAFIRVICLPDPRPFKLFVAAVLLYIGLKMILDLQKQKKATAASVKQGAVVSAGKPGNFHVEVKEFSLRRISYLFQGEVHICPTSGVFLLSTIVGVIGGIYGVGGGAIIAPFLISWYRLPIHTTSGAALMGTFLTSVAGVAFYTLIAPLFPEQAVSPDWMLGLLFGIGGFAGMYFGARCQKFVPAAAIKWMLGLLLLATSFKYVFDYLS